MHPSFILIGNLEKQAKLQRHNLWLATVGTDEKHEREHWARVTENINTGAAVSRRRTAERHSAKHGESVDINEGMGVELGFTLEQLRLDMGLKDIEINEGKVKRKSDYSIGSEVKRKSDYSIGSKVQRQESALSPDESDMYLAGGFIVMC